MCQQSCPGKNSLTDAGVSPLRPWPSLTPEEEIQTSPGLWGSWALVLFPLLCSLPRLARNQIIMQVMKD